ncbi:hypothetical protein RRG08_025881 [Elysia crispata]|uniref:Uncharacterized protein n=1 Tax=Elysia crispata TaxID=231223 RepID=A0AAE0ZPS5_9GAST|nr:hypothetical protein RRG08_025881 [Elysia crispata]
MQQSHSLTPDLVCVRLDQIADDGFHATRILDPTTRFGSSSGRAATRLSRENRVMQQSHSLTPDLVCVRLDQIADDGFHATRILDPTTRFGSSSGRAATRLSRENRVLVEI